MADVEPINIPVPFVNNHCGPFPLVNAAKNIDGHANKKSSRIRPVIVNSCNSESTTSNGCSNKHHRFAVYAKRSSHSNHCICGTSPLMCQGSNQTVSYCKMCSKTFKYKSSLKEHMIICHFVKKQKHICKVCEQSLSSKKLYGTT
ncbi:hypothetical protein QTP88_025289 [Uroleucon formosanum]